MKKDIVYHVTSNADGRQNNPHQTESALSALTIFKEEMEHLKDEDSIVLSKNCRIILVGTRELDRFELLLPNEKEV